MVRRSGDDGASFRCSRCVVQVLTVRSLRDDGGLLAAGEFSQLRDLKRDLHQRFQHLLKHAMTSSRYTVSEEQSPLAASAS